MAEKSLVEIVIFALICKHIECIIVESYVKPLKSVRQPWNQDRYRRNNFEDDDEEPYFGGNNLPFVDNEVPATPRPYQRPGEWATPAPDSGIDLGFTPVQTYLQVRHTNTVRHLPRSDAIHEASSEEEVLNAHRLKEVLRTKKIQEVYSEEGYEDLGYDHGDHERHAEHDEGFSKHKDGKYKVEDPVQHIHDVADAESQVVASRNKPKNPKSKVSRKRVETSSTHMEYMNGKGRKKERSKEEEDGEVNARKEKRSSKDRHRGTKRDFASKKEEFWNFPSSFEELGVTKWNHFEPVNRRKEIERGEKRKPTKPRPEEKQKRKKVQETVKRANRIEEIEKVDEVTEAPQARSLIRIPPVPTFGYIHSLTDAHYGSLSPINYHQTKPIPSHVINLTESFEAGKKEEYPGFEPKKTNKRIKRQLEDEEKRYRDTDVYENELSQNLDDQEKNIVGNALKSLGIKSLDQRYPVLTTPPPKYFSKPKKPVFPWKLSYDSYKYPYYNSKSINPFSPLRYASHPREFPVKSGHGMEFYDNKDRTIQCDPIDVSLDDVSKEESTYNLKVQPGKKKRIVGLGDKIKCMKIKYFGEDPLDSPFFKEGMHTTRQVSSTPAPEKLEIPAAFGYEPKELDDVSFPSIGKDSSVEGSVTSVQRWPPTAPHPEILRIQVPEVEKPKNNTLEDFRVIPVNELAEITTAVPIMGMRPPPRTQFQLPFSVIKFPQTPKPAKLMKKIKYKLNCLQPVTKMTITERSDGDIMYDCQDVTMIRTTRNGNEHIKIIPKFSEKSRKAGKTSRWVIDGSKINLLRAGEVLDGSLKRRKRQAPSTTTRRRSQLFPNKSLLDKLVKRPTASQKSQNNTSNSESHDLGDKSPEEAMVVMSTRKPEVNRAIVTSTTTTAAPTTKQSATSEAAASVKFKPKPLPRLSGTDFLTRYHKNKNSRSKKPDQFWDVEGTTKRTTSHSTGRTVEVQVQIPRDEASKPKTPEPRPFKPKISRSPKIEDRSFQISVEEEEEEKRSLKRKRDDRTGATPALLYVVDATTGQGQWVREDATTESFQAATDSPHTRKPNERQLKKETARRNFFHKKLNPNP